jgi:hypothetical protein
MTNPLIPGEYALAFAACTNRRDTFTYLLENGGATFFFLLSLALLVQKYVLY